MSTMIHSHDELRIEITDTMHIVIPKGKTPPGVVSIIEEDEDELSSLDPGELNLWVDDLQQLIDALLDAKREYRNMYE